MAEPKKTPTPAPDKEKDPFLRFLDDGGGKKGGAFAGLTDSQLATAYKERRITEKEYRDELKAREISPRAIEELVFSNRPTIAQIKPPELTGGAGLADLTALSAADLGDLIGKPDPRDPSRTFTAQDAEGVLRDKGLSLPETRVALQDAAGGEKPTQLSADTLINAWQRGQIDTQTLMARLTTELKYSNADAELLIEGARGEQPETPEWGALKRSLTQRGLGSNLNPAEIVHGAELGLWGADDAYEGLVVFGGMDEATAQSFLQRRGWQGGPTRPIPSRVASLDALQRKPQAGLITPPNVGEAGLATSGAEQWRGLIAQHFKPEDVDKALYVIEGESGGNPRAIGDNGASIGLFQMNTAGGLGTGYQPEQLFDPETNVKLAAQAVYGGRGWADWGEGNTFNGQPFGALGRNPYPGRGLVVGR